MNSTMIRVGWQALIAAFPVSLLFGAPNLTRMPLSFEPGVRHSEFVANRGGSRIVITPAGAAIGENRMRLLGARVNVPAQPEELLPGYSNYLAGSDPRKWRTHVSNYSRVRYRDIYPGIDVVYYGNPSELEFDFIVAPGADPRRIQLALSSRDFHIRLPRVYQAGREVEGRVVRHGSRVNFELASYDHSLPLVIDPVLSYAAVFGGGSSDEGRAIAVDATGAAYVAGNTTSGNFPAAGGKPGYSFLAKLNPQGTALVYTTYLPSLGSGAVYAVDASGRAYLAQGSGGPDFPVIGPPPLRKCGFGIGGPDVAVGRLSPDGTALVYAGCLGGSAADIPNAIAADAAGNAYLTGFTQSADFPLVKPLQSTFPAGQFIPMGFVLKLSPAGALLYSTFLGGGGDSPRAIAVDRGGNAYVTGQTQSADFPLKNAIQKRLPGSAPSAFVAKISPDGSNLVYSTYLGGSNGDSGSAIAADDSGNTYVAGTTPSADFPTTTNALQPRFGGAFAFKTTDGAATWSRSDSGLPGAAFSVQVDPADSSIVYALSSGRLFKSSDGGVTWRSTSADSPYGLWINPADSTLYAASNNGTLSRSRDGGATFAKVTTGVVGSVNLMAFDPLTPSVIYGRWGGSGPGDGVYKSVDAGETWNATGLKGNGEGRGGLVIDPARSSTLYATSNRRGLIQSDDGGDTWAAIDSGSAAYDLQIDSHSRLFAVAGNVILVGSGNTFVTKRVPAYANKLLIDPTNSSTWFVVSYGSGIYKSTDSGDTWQPVNNQLPGSPFIQSLAIDPKSPGTLYLGTGAAPDGFFAKLSADGSTLQYATYIGGTSADSVNAIAVDAAGNAYLAGATNSADFPMQAPFRTGGSGFVAKFDPGNTLAWSSSLGVAQPNAIALGPAGEVYLTGGSFAADSPAPNSIQQGNSGNLFRTTDGGTTWTGTTLPTPYPYSGVSAVAVDPLTPSRVFAIGDRLYGSDDRGLSWKPLGKTGFIPISPLTFALDPVNPTTMYGGGYQFGGPLGVSKSSDGGITWSADAGPPYVVYGLSIDPKTPSTLYAALYYAGMYKSTDSGRSWENIGLTYAAAVAVDPRISEVVYASAGTDFPAPNSTGSIYKSMDAGATWQPINNGLPTAFYANILIADPAVPGRVYAVKSFFTGGMYRSDNGGTNWNAIGSGLPDSVIKVLTIDPGNPSTLYAAPAGGGLYRSTDTGATWRLMPGLELPVVTSIAVDPSNPSVIYIGTQSDPENAFVMKISQ